MHRASFHFTVTPMSIRRLQNLAGQVLLLVLLVVLGVKPLAATPQTAQDDAPEPEAPKIAPASEEGQRALSIFRIPNDLEGNLFAAEPTLANPVAIFVDSQGRVFVCETFRQSKGVEDNRSHMDWLDDDLAAQTVADRLAYIKKHLGDDAINYARYDDRIRLIQDVDHDGVADQDTVFADHFNEVVAGTGAGVLAYRGDVFYTCIPDLWRLRDTDGDGVSDQRESLYEGFGVRFAFRGHDMHGLIIGPDGRLYFSIGDRGYNVETPQGRLKDPASGAVFRCELDGSNLEVFATGLRNPQELAFDQYGNLFTGDNNSDSGDRARFVYVVPGSDSGWRMYYQYLNDRGPFNREKIWHPYHQGQPAYMVPPVANYADGPSGLTYYPGTGFGEQYKHRFFLCDFRGQARNSGILTFRTAPQGAFFELVDSEQLVWDILATDVTFGPRGELFVSDWVHGWEGLDKGRIYRFVSKDPDSREVAEQVGSLLGGGIATADDATLKKLLAHADYRVRLEAQFELVRRGKAELLAEVAIDDSVLMPRLHSLWGLGQLARQDQSRELVVSTLNALVDDNFEEVRSQVWRVTRDIEAHELKSAAAVATFDRSLRVRSLAALALEKIGDSDSIKALSVMLDDNANKDPIIRHAGIMGLTGCASTKDLQALATDASPYVRLAVVVAMRRRELPDVERFLADTDQAVVEEAARAIHDVPIASGWNTLANMIDRGLHSDALARRVINANFRLGGRDHLQALVNYAADDQRPENLRVEVLRLLATWTQPSNRDWVLGDWRPLEPRDDATVQEVLIQSLPALLAGGERVANETAQLAARYGITEVIPFLKTLVENQAGESRERGAALLALDQLTADDVLPIAQRMLSADEELIRVAARQVVVHRNGEAALDEIREAVMQGTMLEQQSAVDLLREQQGESWLPLKRKLMADLLADRMPASVSLEVLEMAADSDDDQLARQLAQFDSKRDPNDSLAAYKEALEGGDAERGRSIFFDRRDLSCVRCHTIGGQGGNVGPDLTHVAKDKDRRYLLESIVAPDQAIAKGYDTLVVVTVDGLIHVGILKNKTDKQLELLSAEGKAFTIPLEDVEETQTGASAMPKDLIEQLSKRELRDLVAFLAQLK